LADRPSEHNGRLAATPDGQGSSQGQRGPIEEPCGCWCAESRIGLLQEADSARLASGQNRGGDSKGLLTSSTVGRMGMDSPSETGADRPCYDGPLNLIVGEVGVSLQPMEKAKITEQFLAKPITPREAFRLRPSQVRRGPREIG
jgi:hypothetical protein